MTAATARPATAREAAAALGAAERLDDLCAERPLPAGWTGKLWALQQGIDHARRGEAPDYLLLTDADIGHAPDNLRALVARAERDGLVPGLADGASCPAGAGRSVS